MQSAKKDFRMRNPGKRKIIAGKVLILVFGVLNLLFQFLGLPIPLPFTLIIALGMIVVYFFFIYKNS